MPGVATGTTHRAVSNAVNGVVRSTTAVADKYLLSAAAIGVSLCRDLARCLGWSRRLCLLILVVLIVALLTLPLALLSLAFLPLALLPLGLGFLGFRLVVVVVVLLLALALLLGFGGHQDANGGDAGSA